MTYQLISIARNFFKNFTIENQQVTEIVINVSKTLSKNTTPVKDFIPTTKVIEMIDNKGDEMGALIGKKNEPIFIINTLQTQEETIQTKYYKEAEKDYPYYLNEKKFGEFKSTQKYKNIETLLKVFKNNEEVYKEHGYLKAIESRGNIENYKTRVYREIKENLIEENLPARFKDDFHYDYHSFSANEKKLFFEKIFIEQLKNKIFITKYENMHDNSRKFNIYSEDNCINEINQNSDAVKMVSKHIEHKEKISKLNNDFWSYNKIELKKEFLSELDKQILKKMDILLNQKDEFLSNIEKEILKGIYEENKNLFLDKYWNGNKDVIKSITWDNFKNIDMSIDGLEINIFTPTPQNNIGIEGIDITLLKDLN